MGCRYQRDAMPLGKVPQFLVHDLAASVWDFLVRKVRNNEQKIHARVN
jgi:hypothetical protein